MPRHGRTRMPSVPLLHWGNSISFCCRIFPACLLECSWLNVPGLNVELHKRTQANPRQRMARRRRNASASVVCPGA